MGKRTRVSDYDNIAKKVRKLEQELMRTRRRNRSETSRRLSSRSTSSGTSTSRSSSSSRSRSSPQRHRAGSGQPMPDTYIEGIPISTNIAAALTSTSTAAAADPAPAGVSSSSKTSADVVTAEVELLPHPPNQAPIIDEEILSILGEDPSQRKSYGENIQPDLAIRLQHIATSGLTKDILKDLLGKHLPPANCTLIEAPALNPEVVAAIPETVLKRDKGIELRQKQRTSAISCIAEALTLLMSSEIKNTGLIQTLMDAAKLMCDSQNTDSAIRRNFVLNTLKKDLKDQLQATKIDKLLFGEGLADTLKAAKAISKSGADMKSTPAKQAPKQNKPAQKHLNWSARPQNHNKPKKAQGTRETTYKNRPASSSKPSSRPAPSHSRHRR